MCLILLAYKVHPQYPLIVAANRDEFYRRPTAPIHYWVDDPTVLAGRDLEKMGTWMGVTTSGRFAALTNYRNPKEVTTGKQSRGEIVADALKYDGDLKEYMQGLANRQQKYPGYNLLAGDEKELYYYSNIGQELQKLEPGIHGVSNHLLNTEWPKVERGKKGLSHIITENRKNLIEELMVLLQHADPALDESLPNTGVSLEWERLLSPLFIQSEHYGTRSSTVLLLSVKEMEYVERVFSDGEVSERSYKVDL
jgi:uncharacterized protein with NRDE domain